MTLPRSRYDLYDEELAELLHGEPRYRVSQLHNGLYRELREPSELTVLPGALRERLGRTAELNRALELITERSADNGETVKWLFTLHDGARIETVLMHYPGHSTVCVSSQAGCAMACSFCATGHSGYERHLSTGEIVEQVVHAAIRARKDGRRLDHVVFMGMGEPFANFDRVWRAVVRIVVDLGLAARHVTISTVGIVPKILLVAEKGMQVNLAVSLHAARNELRDRLVPVNRRYPLEALTEALQRYLEATSRRISFEWALIDKINDTPQDANELARIATSLRAHVNLIPLNPIGPTEVGFKNGSSTKRVREFADELAEAGVTVTIRRTRGRTIDAACGQLAARTVEPGAPISLRAR